MKQIKDNVWQTPITLNYVMECCDCGLRHQVDFRVYKGDIQFKVRRIGKKFTIGGGSEKAK
jgi:hypothetical protein